MHRTRDLFVKQRTQLINMMRGLLAEFGIDIPQGINRALEKARAIVDGEAPDVPLDAVCVVERLSQQALDIHAQVREIERDLIAWQRKSDVATRLMTIPGIGPIGSDRAGSVGQRSIAVPLWSAVRGMAGANAAPEIQRWQGAARAHLEDGRQVSSQASGGRHDGGGAERKTKTRGGPSQRSRLAGTQACAGGHRGFGKQNSEDHLGHHGARRSLWRAPRASAGGIKQNGVASERQLQEL